MTSPTPDMDTLIADLELQGITQARNRIHFEKVALLIARVRALEESLHYSNGVADLAIKLRDAAEFARAADKARIAALVEALRPSAETKAAYIGEFKFLVQGLDEDGEEAYHDVTVPWTTIKEIMAAILRRAALAIADTPTGTDARGKR